MVRLQFFQALPLGDPKALGGLADLANNFSICGYDTRTATGSFDVGLCLGGILGKSRLIENFGFADKVRFGLGLSVKSLDGDRAMRGARSTHAAGVFGSPAAPVRETLPPLRQMRVPRRGKVLREALVLRLIAIDRGVHSVLFGLVAAAGLRVGLWAALRREPGASFLWWMGAPTAGSLRVRRCGHVVQA